MKYLNLISDFMQESAGINLNMYRQSFLKGCLRSRFEATKHKNIKEYIDLLKLDHDEIFKLVSSLTIQVSWFFRNEINLQVLSKIILPRLVQKKRNRKEKLVRIWSAGCAHGEEPYTMAILLKEVLGRGEDKIVVQIFATDISRDSISNAKKGLYDLNAVKNIPFGLLTRYFDSSDDRFRIKAEIRRMVFFSDFDLLGDKGFSPPDAVYANFDIVICQNVLIYYKAAAQNQMIANLARSVSRGGYLVMGSAEEPLGSHKSAFRKVYNISEIYQKL